MIAMVMTTYDGIMSFIFQPIVAVFLSGISVLAICVVGLPLMIPKLWMIWSRAWVVPTGIFTISLCLMYMSWLPQYREYVSDGDTGVQVPTFNTMMVLGGWFLLGFSIVWHPKIGFSGTKKWI